MNLWLAHHLGATRAYLDDMASSAPEGAANALFFASQCNSLRSRCGLPAYDGLKQVRMQVLAEMHGSRTFPWLCFVTQAEVICGVMRVGTCCLLKCAVVLLEAQTSVMCLRRSLLLLQLLVLLWRRGEVMRWLVRLRSAAATHAGCPASFVFFYH
jgi:hypothetical protein